LAEAKARLRGNTLEQFKTTLKQTYPSLDEEYLNENAEKAWNLA